MSDANWPLDAVREFHLKHGHAAPCGFTSMAGRRDVMHFRLRLILEELEEFARAYGFAFYFDEDHKVAPVYVGGEDSDVAAVDGITDLLYTVLGTKISMGIRDLRFLYAVHLSNMTKPVKNRADPLGKPDKDCGYEPPRIAYLLERLKERGR